MDRKANALVQTLKKKKLTLAFAESMTCGLAAHRLAGCIGTSDVFKGGIVCYTPDVKSGLLNIPSATIKKCSCESKEVTQLLAKNLSKLIEADIHAAVTGLASPGGSETKQKPVGTVFISVYYKKKIHNHKQVFKGSPLTIRKKTCDLLYTFIRDLVK
jgi:nicotinamide-nucleotide amidase